MIRRWRLTLGHTAVLDTEEIVLLSAVDRNTAGDLCGLVDSPSADVSLKDGYAIQSEDIAAAREDAAVSLRVLCTVAAGDAWQGRVVEGRLLR